MPPTPSQFKAAFAVVDTDVSEDNARMDGETISHSMLGRPRKAARPCRKWGVACWAKAEDGVGVRDNTEDACTRSIIFTSVLLFDSYSPDIVMSSSNSTGTST